MKDVGDRSGATGNAAGATVASGQDSGALERLSGRVSAAVEQAGDKVVLKPTGERAPHHGRRAEADVGEGLG